MAQRVTKIATLNQLRSGTHPIHAQANDHPLFTELSPPERRLIFSHENALTYPRGKVIFYEGTQPTGLYFVVHGKVKVYKKGLWNHEQIIRLAGPGDLLTFRALGETPEYVVSAAALEDSEILFIALEDFFSVLKTNAAFAFKVIQLLAREFDNAENRVRNFAQMNVRQRLADLLLSLCESYGVDKETGTLAIHLTREELANCVGTATETVVRLLSEFRNKEVLALEGRGIRILDRARLEKAAHPDRISPSAS